MGPKNFCSLIEFLSQNFVPIELGPFEFLEASNRFSDLFGEITSCWLLSSFSKRPNRALKNLKPCFFISKYQIRNNNTIIKRLKRLNLFYVFSKGPRSKQNYDHLLLGIRTPQAYQILSQSFIIEITLVSNFKLKLRKGLTPLCTARRGNACKLH